MSVFVDTSALVKYYYPENDSHLVEHVILKADRVYISELSRVELASALMKKVRLGELRPQDKSLIWESFSNDLLAANVEVINLSENDYVRASELILDHGRQNNLRALDSLQLAAAKRTPTAHFLAADRVLSNVAEIVGLKIMHIEAP